MRTQYVIPEDTWSVIASFLPIVEQFSILYASKRIQQIVLASILQNTENGLELFNESLHHQYNNIALLLLSHDLFDPSVCYKNNTTIEIASRCGNTEVVRLLLSDNRVDPSANDNFAIQGASMNGCVDVVRLLLSDNRVDPSARNNYAI